MTNWKTTLGGVLIALAPVVHQLPYAWAYWVSMICTTLGGALLGGTAADADKSLQKP